MGEKRPGRRGDLLMVARALTTRQFNRVAVYECTLLCGLGFSVVGPPLESLVNGRGAWMGPCSHRRDYRALLVAGNHEITSTTWSLKRFQFFY